MAAVKPADTGTSKPEYQHFTPQFLLRNFSHQYTGRTKKAQELYRNEKVLNVLNIGQDEPSFSEKPIKRMFGRYDMYTDDSALSQDQRRRVETELSKLESEASEIFRKLVSACDAGENLITFTRHEKFVLRRCGRP